LDEQHKANTGVSPLRSALRRSGRDDVVGGSADNSRFLRCATEWKWKGLRNGNGKGYGMEMEKRVAGGVCSFPPFAWSCEG